MHFDYRSKYPMYYHIMYVEIHYLEKLNKNEFKTVKIKKGQPNKKKTKIVLYVISKGRKPNKNIRKEIARGSFC